MIVSPFFLAVRNLLSTVVWLYTMLVIVAVIVSWVNPDPWNPLVRFLRKATEPAFALIRRWIPFAVIGGLDLSPLILLVGLNFLHQFVDGVLLQLARGF